MFSSSCPSLAGLDVSRTRDTIGRVDLGKKTVTAFDPRDPAYRGKLWVRVATSDREFYHVFWRRLAVLAGLLGAAAWLGLAGAAWGFVKYRRGFAAVRYLDLAFYPLRHTEYRASLGRHYLAEGRAALERKEYQTSYSLLHAGLDRVPDDLAARRDVAALEIGLGRPERALRTLSEGLRFARDDLDFLKLLFGLLLEVQEDQRVITLAGELLPPQPDQQRPHQFIALQAALAHYHRGRAEQAERIVADWNLERSLEGQILLARCDWDRGLRDAALQRLEREVATFPKRDEIYLELVRLHRESGHLAEARRFALLRQFNEPSSPGPRVDLLHAYHAANDAAAGQRELADYLAAFGHDAKALLLLAAFAVDTRQPALAAQIATLAAERSFPLPLFALARVQVLIAVRDFPAAAEVAEAALREETAGPALPTALLNAQRAVALFGLGEPARAQALLAAFLDTPWIRANDALLLSSQLLALDQKSPARRVLARAVQLDPLNQPALAELVRLDAAEGDRAAVAQNLPALLSMRKPSRRALEEILRHLREPNDEPLRIQIRAALDRTG